MSSTTTPITSPFAEVTTTHKRGLGIRGTSFMMKGITTLILAAGAVVILIPLAYMISISLRDRSQVRQGSLELIPMRQIEVPVNGKDEPLYNVTIDGQTSQMALLKKAPGGKGIFADPAKPDQT